MEKDIEAYFKRQVERNGGKCLKFVSPGHDAVPDRIVLTPSGRREFAEVKNGSRGRLSPRQKLVFDEWIGKYNIKVWVISTKEEADAFVAVFF